MAVKWYFKILCSFICFHPAISQQLDGNLLKNRKCSRITLNARGLAFPSFNDDTQLEPDNIFDFSDETQMSGLNFGINYYIFSGVSVGLGSGLEYFRNPDFRYFPIFMRIALNGGNKKNSIHTACVLGGHITNRSEMGILARFYLGYRFRVFKDLFADFSMVYTFQNLYQSFPNSGRLDDYYNFESIGLSVGIDLN